MLADVLPSILDPDSPHEWGRLGEHLPFDWIGQALVQTGKASIRHRRLPAEQVVWLVIAMALPNAAASFVSKSAVTLTGIRTSASKRLIKDVCTTHH